MSTPSNEKTAKHLMNLIDTRNGDVPNFSLLLGSGASSTSGVKTAEEMIEEWRRHLFGDSGMDYSYQEWIAKQKWYRHEDEYSILFEEIFDQPSQRRVYVEECVKNAHPNWGYVYLTNLLQSRFFDVVFTTNFDDLINEACYLYSHSLRPVVAAHDSAIQGIRVTSNRPKIIKLHGDFLYDNIKNTLAELETLENNTKRKLNQFAQEYGLVVVGYSGRDRSVMDTLELLLRDEENFKQGIYWCNRRGTSISDRLESLLRRDRVYLINVEGFDEFMAELHTAVKLTLPKPIAQPFEMARDRARLITDIDERLRSHPIIGVHAREVLRSVSTPSPKLPLAMEATILSSRGEFNEAIISWKQAHEEEPENGIIAYQYADALADAGRDVDLANFIPTSPLADYNKTYFLLRAGLNQEVIELATRSLSEPTVITGGHYDGRAIVRINRAIALKRLGQTNEMNVDLEFLEANDDTADAALRAGVAALRKEKREMLLALREALDVSLSPKLVMVFPVFEDYRDDSEFLEVVRSSEFEADD